MAYQHYQIELYIYIRYNRDRFKGEHKLIKQWCASTHSMIYIYVDTFDLNNNVSLYIFWSRGRKQVDIEGNPS